MKRDEALAILSELRPQLEARGVVHAGLFGSVARGEAGPRSDVDVVISLTAEKWPSLFNRGGIQVLLEEAFSGRDVDVLVEPIVPDRLREAVARDRMHAF